jgi:hypothetical protein
MRGGDGCTGHGVARDIGAAAGGEVPAVGSGAHVGAGNGRADQRHQRRGRGESCREQR